MKLKLSKKKLTLGGFGILSGLVIIPAVAAACGNSGTTAPSTSNQAKITVTIPAVQSNTAKPGYLPEEYGANGMPGKESQVNNPEISWTAVAGAQSYALLVSDPDSIPVVGYAFIHWAVANIPGNMTKVAKDSSHNPAAPGTPNQNPGYRQAINGFAAFPRSASTNDSTATKPEQTGVYGFGSDNAPTNPDWNTPTASNTPGATNNENINKSNAAISMYFGPEAPNADHSYLVEVYALNEMLPLLPNNAPFFWSTAFDQMQDHIIGYGRTTFKYERWNKTPASTGPSTMATQSSAVTAKKPS
ncbi:YbhB/YbcL family Raf kinase inhibitor-like protein [[Mycoplasma] testudinis]|uniref:YbhB/YbcL family Raf kinase inhibitor-like protein n=1 Tax=[Mycoplasma] testudinis TaxID=33924 RepID=UPI000489A2C3|nr:hypothetical protein [[Mycoplasma] testudinis]